MSTEGDMVKRVKAEDEAALAAEEPSTSRRFERETDVRAKLQRIGARTAVETLIDPDGSLKPGVITAVLQMVRAELLTGLDVNRQMRREREEALIEAEEARDALRSLASGGTEVDPELHETVARLLGYKPSKIPGLLRRAAEAVDRLSENLADEGVRPNPMDAELALELRRACGDEPKPGEREHPAASGFTHELG